MVVVAQLPQLGCDATTNNCSLPLSLEAPPECNNSTVVECRESDGVIVALRLARSALRGRLPPSFAGLAALSHLDLAHNHLSGTQLPILPAELTFIDIVRFFFLQ